MKLLGLLFFAFATMSISAQNTYTQKYNVQHGDTMFLKTSVITFSIDSLTKYVVTTRYNNDSSAVITDSVPYKQYFRVIDAVVSDSVQINKLAIQPPLQSGVNVKTINNEPILGSGNLSVSTAGVNRVFLPGDVINNNAVANTIADVTGLSFPVNANTTYRFKFLILYTSAATTTGSRWCINGPATTFLNYYSTYTLTGTSITNNQGLASYNVPAASSASSLASGNIAIIEGIIRPSASGNVIARFASEISASAITAIGNGRSYVEYEIIN